MSIENLKKELEQLNSERDLLNKSYQDVIDKVRLNDSKRSKSIDRYLSEVVHEIESCNGYVYRVTYHQKDGLDEARIKKCRIDLHQNIISICEDCSYEYLIYRFSVLELFDNLGVSIFRTKNEACKALASHVLNTWS